LGLATFTIANTLIGHRSTAEAKPHAVSQDDGQDLYDELRAAKRQPFMTYHDIVNITPQGDDGRIGPVVDVEARHGPINLPNTPEAMRAMRLRVTVYSPDDPGCQGEPLKVWESPAVDVVEGLYQEQVPVDIPMAASPKPYPVVVELVSAGSVKHKPLRSDEEMEAPVGLSGKRITFRVQ
jgi:hypothetical protein